MEQYQDVNSIYAIIIGTVLGSEGKVSLTRVNNIAKDYGLDRINQETLQEYYNDISNDKEFNSLLSRAIKGELGLENILNYESEQVFENSDYTNSVPPYIVAKEEQLSQAREFRKIYKEGAYLESLFKGLRKDLKKEFKDFATIVPEIVTEPGVTKKTIVLAISDIHIGFSFKDYVTGGYNFNILKQRLEKYLLKAEQIIKQNDITDIRLYFVGDLIEHVSMRNVNQAFDTEFTLSEQIAKGTRLLADIINRLSQYGHVTFACVHGNHDRMNGNKNDKIYNDSAMYIALDQLILLNENGAFDNVDIIDNRMDIYNARDSIKGYTIHLNHGDTLSHKKPCIVKFERNGLQVDMLITGHVHHFSLLQEDNHKIHIVNSSPIGANNYSKELMLGNTSPSQTIIVFDHNDLYNPTIIPVFLN